MKTFGTIIFLLLFVSCNRSVKKTTGIPNVILILSDDMEADRTEIINLADQNPEIVREMAVLWQDWAERTNTIPKPE
jgi:hypothetical protein